MKTQRPKRPFSWFLIIVFLFFVSGILITGFLFYQAQQEGIKVEAQNNLRAIADLKAKQIAGWRRERIADGNLIHNNVPLNRLVDAYLKSPQKIELKQELLSEMRSFQTIEGYESVVLVDAQQIVRLSAAIYGDSIGGYGKKLIDEAIRTRTVILSDLHISGPLLFAHLDMVIPLISLHRADNAILGAFLLRIDPNIDLFPLIQTWPRPSNTSETILLERDGEEVVYLNELRHKKNTTLNLRFPISHETRTAVMAALGMEGIVEGIDYRGVEVLAALKSIPNSPWYLISKVDREEIFAPLRSQAWIVGSGVFFLILITGSTVGYWWRNQQAKFFREKYLAELERQALVKHYDYSIKHANDIILLINMEGRIVEANDQACRIYGYTREELLQKYIRNLRAPQTRSQIDKALKQVEEQGGSVFETEHIRKDGTVFPVEVSARFIRIEGTRFYQSIVRDISERKQAEQALRDSERRLSLHIQQTPLGFIEWDTDFRVVKWNPASEKIFGYAIAEARGQHAKFIVPEKYKYHVDQVWNDLLAQKGGYRSTNENTTKDGRNIFCEWYNTPLVGSEGKVIGVASIVEDITERKQAEMATQAAREYAENLIQTANTIVIGLNTEGTIIVFNKAAEEITGYSQAELENRNWFEVLAPKDRYPEVWEEFNRLVAGGVPKRFENPILTKSGQERHVVWSNSEVIEHGKIVGTISFGLDITDRKKAEEALLESEEIAHALLNAPSEAAYLLDKNRRIIALNAAGAQRFDKNMNELIGVCVDDLFPPEVTEARKKLFDKIIRSPKPIHFIDDRAGKRLENSFYPIYDTHGKVSRIAVFSRDITERMRSEEALKRSEDRFRRLAENAVDIIYRYEYFPERRFTYVSPAAATITGYTPEEHYADPDLGNKMVHPEDRIKLEPQNLMAQSSSAPLILRWIRKDGITIWTEQRNVPIYDETGKLIAVEGIARDITDRMRTEESLQEIFETLNTIIEAAPLPIFAVDLDGRVQNVWNPAAERMLGWKKGEVLGKLLPSVSNEKKTEYQQFLKQMRSGQLLNGVQVARQKKDGTQIEYSIYSSPLHDHEGKITGSILLLVDLTEQRRAEEAIRQTEGLFKMLVESSPVAIAVFSGPSKKLEYVSRRFAELFGYEQEDLSSMDDWWSLAYPAEEYRNQIEIKWCEIVEKAIREENDIEPMESVITCKDGSTRYIETTFTSVGEETLVFFTDLTQHRMAQEALRQTHAFNELLIQTMPFGMDIVDEEGNILFMSKVMKDMLGANITDKRCWEVYRDDKQQCADCPLFKGITFGKPDIVETAGVFGGKTYQISHIGMMYEGKRAMLEVFQDITEQKKLQQELIQSQKLLSIGTMAGGIAHDFNNILAIILGYSSILHSIKDNQQKFTDGVTAIRQAVDRGAGLVRQILTFARKTDISFEPLNISELVYELVSMLQQTFPKIITFNVNVDKHLPYINADHTQMHQALLNLCVNARDAMPNGGEITIKTEVLTGERLKEQFPSASNNWYICLNVSDTGIGMDESIRNQIFDPFFTTKEKGKGTGLGLSVVYGIVQAHHGYIDVESSAEQGTIFHLYFPVPQESSSVLESQEQVEQQISGGNETILFVEDEALLLDMVQILLESNGYIVLTARDGEEAVNVYTQHAQEIALVISDMGLPKLMGLAEFNKLKEINPAVKIIFASGYFEPEIKGTLENAGAKGFLQKPYVIEDILSKIRKVLDSK